MKRQRIWLLISVIALALISSGCSKEKAAQQAKLAELESKATQLEAKNKDLTEQGEKAALKAAEEKLQLEDAIKGYQVRLIHNPLEAFRVEPAASVENGWLLVEGEHTYILKGHDGATKVRFYWADASKQGEFQPNLLGEDTVGKDGWSWQGTLPYGHTKAFWAEVHYAGGVRVNSAVLPVRNAGK